MKLMFNKTTYEGHWFYEESDRPGNPEDTAGYTEKVPPDTSYVWDEEQDGWIRPPEPIQE